MGISNQQWRDVVKAKNELLQKQLQLIKELKAENKRLLNLLNRGKEDLL